MTADYTGLVETFAVSHRARESFWRLLGAGSDALPAVRAGLHHANADVRSWCCRYLDHFVDGDSMDELIAMLDDPDPEVRMRSLHALTCDNCKEPAASMAPPCCCGPSRCFAPTAMRTCVLMPLAPSESMCTAAPRPLRPSRMR